MEIKPTLYQQLLTAKNALENYTDTMPYKPTKAQLDQWAKGAKPLEKEVARLAKLWNATRPKNPNDGLADLLDQEDED